MGDRSDPGPREGKVLGLFSDKPIDRTELISPHKRFENKCSTSATLNVQ